MATTSQAVTTTPTAVAGLTSGTAYSIQFHGIGYLYISEGAAAPDADTAARNRYQNDANIPVKPATGEDIYIWAQMNDVGTISINEAV